MGFRRWLEARKPEIVPVGDCFRYATMTAIEMATDGIIPEDQIVVVHGTVHPKWHPRPYAHAWIESRGRCFDWQMRQTKVGSIPVKDFYAEYNPTDMTRYTWKEAMRNMIRSKHHGPWS